MPIYAVCELFVYLVRIEISNMLNTARVNADADYGLDFHTLVDHMTQLRNFTKGYFHFN